MACEKTLTLSSVDVIFEWLMKVEFMAAHQDRAFMRHAIKVMRDVGVVKKSGGPFGAVIVKHGKVIAAAGNTVIRDNDPSVQALVDSGSDGCRRSYMS